MLFEEFNIVLIVQEQSCELDVRERHSLDTIRQFEIIQGGINIMLMMFKNGVWTMYIVDGLHPTVKQDTLLFVSQELIDLLIQAIVNYYDCFTQRKIK
jgi:hypothetical protein